MNRYHLCCIAIFFSLLLLCGCSNDPAFHADTSEALRAVDSLNEGRPEDADFLPELSKDISDVRITIVPRTYDPPSDYADLQDLSFMQIWYGYYADGQWNDYPSENYELSGILQHNSRQGWKASVGSHLVKIGPYLLICICLHDDPMVEYHLSDTLDSQIQQPFEAYNTCLDYYDENGQRHDFMDTHETGYGYIAEDPSTIAGEAQLAYIVRSEFPRRYYVLLDYESIPEDYVLTISQVSSVPEQEESQSLTFDMIQEAISKNDLT